MLILFFLSYRDSSIPITPFMVMKNCGYLLLFISMKIVTLSFFDKKSATWQSSNQQ
ncbi:hypothetical protein ACZ87_01675 [Candidatus Erwinia dacicola]|uniref:Uncharacterized protein n=1 Tax=Candidatus Erwinia dacicola TaxID=252393 RepID=A0A328TUH4_9GAMM|nr:hypothetical protein ACZ87_01675 [Candidatus Erwinia dacicola]